MSISGNSSEKLQSGYVVNMPIIILCSTKRWESTLYIASIIGKPKGTYHINRIVLTAWVGIEPIWPYPIDKSANDTLSTGPKYIILSLEQGRRVNFFCRIISQASKFLSMCDIIINWFPIQEQVSPLINILSERPARHLFQSEMFLIIGDDIQWFMYTSCRHL